MGALQAATAEFAREKCPQREGQARAALALALKAEGKGTDARAAIAEAIRLAGETESLPSRNAVWLAAAQVGADRAAVRRHLNALAETLAKDEFVSEELPARLALAQLDESEHAPRAKAELAALASRARKLGFDRIARLAAR